MTKLTTESIAQMTAAERAEWANTAVTKRQLVTLTDADRAAMLIQDGRYWGVGPNRPASWMPRAAAELKLRRMITRNLLDGRPRHSHAALIMRLAAN